MSVADPWEGQGKLEGLLPVLQGRGTSRPGILVRDMGPDASYGTDPWGLPPQGGLSSNDDTDVETSSRGVVISTTGEGYAGGVSGNNQKLHRFLPEHNLPIYHDQSNIGDLSFKRGAHMGTGKKLMVVT